MSNSIGWGNLNYGSTSYGSGPGVGTSLILLNAVAISDNIVQLSFNYAVIYNKLRDSFDGSNFFDYIITPMLYSVGADNLAPRAVNPIEIDQTTSNTILNVTVDRPFSPFPGQYKISVQSLMGTDGVNTFPINQILNSQYFYGLSRGLPVQRQDMVTSSKDIANQQFSNSLVGNVPTIAQAYQLGTIPTNSQGDIATDDGLDSYTKRVLRRCMTRKGGFAHLGADYGLGLPYQIKQLANQGIRNSLAGDAEAQILQEPETKQVKCTFTQDPKNPSLFWLNAQITTIFGNSQLPVSIPIYIS